MSPFVGGTGVSYPTALIEVGLGIETTRGTLLAEPSYMLPIKAPKYKPDQAYIPDETLQGVMVQVLDEIAGMRYDSHGWDAPPYFDSFPVLACCELGSPDTKTAAVTATTLAAAAAAGATTISAAASVAVGSWISIGAEPTIETHRTSGVTGSGPYSVTLDPKTGPLVFAQASGNAVTGLTKHQFSVLNNANQGQPPSASLWDFSAEQWRSLTAAQLDELTIKGNSSGLVDYTCTWFANAAALGATQPSTSYTTTETALPWSFVAYFGGGQVQTVTSWEFSFKRQVKPVPALTGTQYYFQYLAGPIQATAKITFLEQSGSPYLADYENGTKQALYFTIFDPQGNSMLIQCSSALFTTGELDRSTEYVTVPVTVQMLPTTTDATAGGKSPVLFEFGNAVTTAYH